MSNLEIVNQDTSVVPIGDNEYKTATFTAVGANTYPAGTVLARNSSTDKWEVYVDAGANGTGIAKSVLQQELITTGAGDVGYRIMEKGRVDQNKLSIFGGGGVTEAMIDSLRDYGILCEPVEETGRLDNQP